MKTTHIAIAAIVLVWIGSIIVYRSGCAVSHYEKVPIRGVMMNQFVCDKPN
jgi:hypothetical protein